MMTQDEGKRVHRHPDAVAYLEGLGEEGASMVRPHEGGRVRHWIEGGEVRSLEIAEDGPLPALLEAVSAEFGPQPPKLAADLASGVPELDGVGRALRDAALGGGATALKQLVEQLDRALPAPRCESCGKPMRRCQERKRKSFPTRLGRVGFERTHFHCRSCGKGCYPLDRALGLERSAFTPGMASVMAGTVPLTGFDAASRHIANPAGVDATSSSLQRWSLALGEEALRFEREEVVGGRPLESRMHLSIDGTGIPMRKEDVEGVAGKQDNGSSRTREAKLAVMYTAEGRDPETGAALKDSGSETSGCLIDSAAAPSGSKEPSEFAVRLNREAQRRGLHDAGELVVISDGAEWIRNTCDELFGGRKVTCVLDIFHALEYASDAVKAIV